MRAGFRPLWGTDSEMISCCVMDSEGRKMVHLGKNQLQGYTGLSQNGKGLLLVHGLIYDGHLSRYLGSSTEVPLPE